MLTTPTDPNYVQHLLMRMEEYHVPENLRQGLSRYLCQRIRPGGFLTSALENNLHEACALYSGTPYGLFNLMKFIHSIAPAPSWGTKENVAEWIASQEPVPMPYE